MRTKKLYFLETSEKNVNNFSNISKKVNRSTHLFSEQLLSLPVPSTVADNDTEYLSKFNGCK